MKWKFALASSCLALAGTISAHAQPQEDLDLREFVRGDSYPNSYRDLSEAYDASVTPELAELLTADPGDQNLDRVAALLGAVGDQRAVGPLIQFVETPRNTELLTDEEAAARKAAIISLGVLVNRTGSQRALNYLIDGLTPNTWIERNVQGRAAWPPSQEEYFRMLSEYSLYGLAMSGHPAAGDALRALQRSPTPQQAEFRRNLDDTLTQWLEVHSLVAERGIEGMYEYYDERSEGQPVR